MADFFEIDLLDVEAEKSGDAITLRYCVNEKTSVHVVDGGYIDTGDLVIDHLSKHYGGTDVDHVVLTHPDQDHANGLRKVLENCNVGKLWMHRPWLYAEELLPRFPTYKSLDALKRKLKELYPGPAALEEIANERGIQIGEPFQGTKIGEFLVAAPSRARYLDLVVESDRTPQHETNSAADSLSKTFAMAMESVKKLVKRLWGEEYFPEDGTSNENEMSVVQFGVIRERRILLTGDVGREGLTEAADYVETQGYTLPGVWCFQVPHHGGRHNVNSEVLNRWLGPVLAAQPEKTTWNALCSSAKADEHHPKKSVVRAILHRGGHFSSTEGKDIHLSVGLTREGYKPIPQADYPDADEE